jgi:CxxC-x17-CxxC domain-containing protein
MKQASKNETALLDVISKIQVQLAAVERKIDSLIGRSLPPAKPPQQAPAPQQARMKYTAICADCKKECTIPFKPSGDRPVYCQDCFSRRKVISMSKISVPAAQSADQPIETPKSEVKPKKKSAAAKKPAAKKKTAPKKK